MEIAGFNLAAEWIDDLTQERQLGHVINSSYCPVRDKWMLLIAGEDGKFHSVHAEGVEVHTLWTPTFFNDEDQNGS